MLSVAAVTSLSNAPITPAIHCGCSASAITNWPRLSFLSSPSRVLINSFSLRRTDDDLPVFHLVKVKGM